MSSDKALVIFSGGQDSTTCLAQAVRDYGQNNVSCITFQYGQKHAHEVNIAKTIATYFGVTNHLIISLDWYAQITTNALLDHQMPISNSATLICPNTVVDGRNMLFLLVAAINAKQKGIHDVIIGVCEADFSGYPDCREIFVTSCNKTLNLAMDYSFRVLTPLMHLTKAQTWALADELGVLAYVAKHTLTCYNGIVGVGCGTCPSCVLRQNGYERYLKSKGQLC